MWCLRWPRVGILEDRKLKPNQAGLTILIVDDESDIREILALSLENEGCIALQAQNGQEAIQMLRKTSRFPSVVVLDLSMPVLDGRGFLYQRAADRILAEIPVIVVSGSSHAQGAARGRIDAI
jgi:CheY-like chemotaxis protein